MGAQSLMIRFSHIPTRCPPLLDLWYLLCISHPSSSRACVLLRLAGLGHHAPPPQVPGRSPLRQMATPRRRLPRNGFSTSEIENEKGLSVSPPPSFTFLSLPLYPIPFPRVPRRFPSPRTLFSLPCRCAVLSPLLGLGASLLLPSLFRP